LLFEGPGTGYENINQWKSQKPYSKIHPDTIYRMTMELAASLNGRYCWTNLPFALMQSCSTNFRGPSWTRWKEAHNVGLADLSDVICDRLDPARDCVLQGVRILGLMYLDVVVCKGLKGIHRLVAEVSKSRSGVYNYFTKKPKLECGKVTAVSKIALIFTRTQNITLVASTLSPCRVSGGWAFLCSAST